MKNLWNNKTRRTNLITYLVVIAAFVLMQGLSAAGMFLLGRKRKDEE